MTDRMPAVPAAELTAPQRAASDAFHASRGVQVFGPFTPLLRSPDLMLRVQKVGEYCRYENSLGLRLSEFIILLVARRHDQPLEWAIHAPIAAKAGVPQAVIDQIADGRRPQGMNTAEALIHDALAEMWAHDAWCDATYEAVKAAFGEQGVIDLVVTASYYALLANVMNVTRTAAPEGPVLPRLQP